MSARDTAFVGNGRISTLATEAGVAASVEPRTVALPLEYKNADSEAVSESISVGVAFTVGDGVRTGVGVGVFTGVGVGVGVSVGSGVGVGVGHTNDTASPCGLTASVITQLVPPSGVRIAD